MPKASQIKFFVEPFAGSASIAYLFYNDNSKSKTKYFINDTDSKLIDFYSAIQQNKFNQLVSFVNKNFTSKDFQRIQKKKEKNLKEWFYTQKVYNIHQGINPFKNKNRKISKIDKNKYEERIQFDKKTYLSSLDFTEIMDLFKNKKNAFLFIDPPYLDSFNSNYSDFKDRTDKQNNIIDKTDMYIQLREYIEVAKCKIMIVINSNAIIKYIFQGYIKQEYNKQYSQTKKNTNHLIITNY